MQSESTAEVTSAHVAALERLPNGSAAVAALRRKIIAIDERTFGSIRPDHEYGYLTDPQFIRATAPHLLDALSQGLLDGYVLVGEVSERLGLTPKPQLILEFARDGAPNQVLKVYGRERENEGWLRQELSSAGLPVVNVSAHKMASDGGWILMDMVDGGTLEQLWSRSTPTEQDTASATEHIATAASQIHDFATRKPVVRTLMQGVSIHVRIAAERLGAAGHDASAGLWDLFELICAEYPTVLTHGDISAGNVLLDNSGATLIDASGYMAPRSYDGAAWIARAGTSTGYFATIAESWLSTETDLNPSELAACLEVELLRHAGLLLMESSINNTSDQVKRLVELANRINEKRFRGNVQPETILEALA